MPAGGLITAGALGLGTAIYGGIEASQAKKAAMNNIANRPQYNPLPEDDSELNLAESQAGTGMSAAAKQSLLNNSQNSEAAALNATLRGGGDANAIGSIADKSQQALNSNAIYDNQAQQAHVGTLLNTFRQYNNQRQANSDKQFQINQYAPWADRQQLYTQQMQAGQNMLNSGLKTLGSGLSSLGGGSDDPDVTLGRGGGAMSSLPVSGATPLPTPAPTPGMAPYYSYP